MKIVTPEGKRANLSDTSISSSLSLPNYNYALNPHLSFIQSTLDALMQVIVCKEDIGWRGNSRKIVVVATDQVCFCFKPWDTPGLTLGECSMRVNETVSEMLKQACDIGRSTFIMP